MNLGFGHQGLNMLQKELSAHLWPLTKSVLRMAIGICIGEVTAGLNKSNFRAHMRMKAWLGQAQQRMQGEIWELSLNKFNDAGARKKVLS